MTTISRLHQMKAEQALRDIYAESFKAPVCADDVSRRLNVLWLENSEGAERLPEEFQIIGHCRSGDTRCWMKWLEKQSLDFIVSDIGLPNLDTIGLLKFLRSFHPTCSLRLISVNGTVNEIENRLAQFSAGTVRRISDADEYITAIHLAASKLTSAIH